SGEAERLRSKQPEVAVTDGRDALRRVRCVTTTPSSSKPKITPMNVPAHGTGGALVYNFAARSSDE
ncbi:MAG: hypothetical protein IKR48_08945, partial [Kiritimatiellae bacterium]|nr:hypothetical protein [Kiritimatiellia bacterium]